MTGLRLVCALLFLLPVACSRGNVGQKPAAAEQEDEALMDDEAIPRAPWDADSYVKRGDGHAERGEYEKAIADYQEAMRLDPGHAEAHDSLAWLLATCPADGVRDGKRAVELATKACELSEWEDAEHVSTLAAAHAECGNFKEAVKWQTKAIEIGFEEDDDMESAREQLKLYQQRQPYRAE
ncbi:MAG TPA: tetratricopeptide repeat protein [Gemmataceae bacterium]|nr:tetratricopeptide repeat protein [Gemmataceae bacterium]